MSLNYIDIGKDFNAVSGVFTDNDFLTYLQKQENIDYIETNALFKTTAPTITKKKQKNRHLKEREEEQEEKMKEEEEPLDDDTRVLTKRPSNWGLARITQHERGSLEEYTFDSESGTDIDVYVLDTGVYPDHSDFGGRANCAVNFVKTEEDVDKGGHGTHVSGKVIGQEYGVAKNANIQAVKILNKRGEGSTALLLKGLEYVMNNAKPGKSLVNLSLSGPRSKVVDQALNALVEEHNIPIFASAGNMGTDACRFSPSSNPNVFTVGSIDVNDRVSYFSNFGECVNIYAPGSGIISSYIGDVDAFKSMDGTSMASPHVAGVAANMMSMRQFNSPHELYNSMTELGTRDILEFVPKKDTQNNTNLLVYNPLTM
ncbi:subtilisin-like protein [Backusella circina FSU 941]|nr:subtilisin-like protein [Backusella circina FSU 941]